MDSKVVSEKVDQAIRSFVPKWKVIDKRDSLFHKLIGIILSPLIDYTNDFWTTIGFTAASPPGDVNRWQVRPHEGRHAIQAKKWTRPLFGFLYLFPQSLAPIFVLLAFLLSPWWLLGLVCLLPWPAPFRMVFELHAYQLSIMINTWRGYSKDYIEYDIKFLANEIFAGPSYYWMWPDKGYVINKLQYAHLVADNWDVMVGSGAHLSADEYHIAIYDTLKRAGAL